MAPQGRVYPESHMDPKSKQLLRTEKLIQASQSLAQIESLDLLLPKLLEMAEEVTLAESSAYFQYDQERDELRFRLARRGGHDSEWEDVLKEQIVLKPGQGIAGTCLKTGQSLLVSDVDQDERFSQQADKVTGMRTTDVLCAPVRYQDQVLGVIEVLNCLRDNGFDTDDQRILESFASLAAMAIFRTRMLEEKIEQQELSIQMQTAAKIQASFFGQMPELGHGSDLAGDYKPAKLVGGDLYDCITLPDQSVVLYLADVSGKGLPAALVAVALWANVRDLAYQAKDMGDLLQRLNLSMYEYLDSQFYFVTMFICRYWPKTGILQTAAAGHPPPLWLGKSGFKDFPVMRNLPVGAMIEVDYTAQEVTLADGDALLFCSDGVTEAFSPMGEVFGSHRVAKHMLENPGPPWGESLLKAVRKWQAQVEQSDDITLLELWRQG